MNGLVTWYRVQNLALPAPTYQGSPTWTPAAWPPTGPPTITGDATVLLALLLRVELVAVALAAPIGKEDALSLDSIKCPELGEAFAGATDYGEVAGRCGVGGRHTALVILTVG